MQTYQPYTESQSPTRQIHAHITYHVAQANQATHGSFVDRGVNGGLAGSDVTVLNTSSRKCTITGIDNHELPGPDLVQCAALVDTNYGIVNVIMNEYGYHGRGHSIHSSGQMNGVQTLWMISQSKLEASKDCYHWWISNAISV